MAIETIQRARHLRGTPVIPGDKSVSHRSLMFGALASGETVIHNLLNSADVASTAACLTQLGVQIRKDGPVVHVKGCGGYRFQQPTQPLDCGNSGTTMRLMMGILAGQPITVTLTGDASLSGRPMKRVADPLRKMKTPDAEMREFHIALREDNFAPVRIHGCQLQGIDYELKIASAQIKTAIILAGLNARGTTRITGEIHSRDHTERMLAHFGVHVESNEHEVTIQGGQSLRGREMHVPGDPSTAAFWIAAAALVPQAHVQMHHVSLNPSRTGFLEAVRKMGARIETQIQIHDPEPMGLVTVEFGKLRGIHIRAQDVPALIDEIPMLAVLASQAEGVTLVEGAEELRVKESDRLEAVAQNLRAMGIVIETRPDGFRIEGPQPLKGATIETFHDHRIAMAFAIAGLVADGETHIQDAECAGVSYPEFFATLRELVR